MLCAHLTPNPSPEKERGENPKIYRSVSTNPVRRRGSHHWCELGVRFLLLVFPLRFTFFNEGTHAFFHIITGKEQVERFAFILQAAFNGGIE